MDAGRSGTGAGGAAEGEGIAVGVLVANTVREPGLLAEHGLSLWIEARGARLLFDTGQGPAIARNAERMGVDLARADAIVLSHGHYDHTGGLPHALGRAPRARLFLHPAALAPRYSRRDAVSREIGMPAPARRAVEERRAAIAWTGGPTRAADGVFVTGPVPRRTAFEDTGGPFFLDADGRDPDPLTDDQALWIETGSGLVVLLGCGHSGVVNTLEYVRETTGGRPIRAVLGGMHLVSASEMRLAHTVEALRRLGVGESWPGHCTGNPAMARLTAAFGDACRPLDAGTWLRF